MSDRPQLVQLRSVPWNRIARRHPGELMIPIRLRDVGAGPADDLSKRLTDTVALQGIATAANYRITLPSQQDVFNNIGGFAKFTFAFEVTTFLGSDTQVLTDNNLNDGLNLNQFGGVVKIRKEGEVPTSLEITNPAWGEWEVGDRRDVEMIIEQLTATDGRVTSCKVDDIEATVGLNVAHDVTGLNFIAIGNALAGNNFGRYTLIYFLCEFADGVTQSLWGIDEGSGTTTIDESAGVVGTIEGVESTDWDWVTVQQGNVPPDLLLGLISQADVNTRGRTDDAPFDHFLNAVATNLLGPSVVSGDGGTNGMQYAALTSGQGSRLPTFPSYAFPTGDFTCCVRFKVTDDTFTGSFMTFGEEFGSNNPVVQQRWQATLSTLQILQDDALNSSGSLVQPGIVVGTEHVGVLRRTGDLLETFLDGVAGPTADVSALGAITLTWGGWGTNFRNATSGSLDGVVYWSSVYDRSLNDNEVDLVDDDVNPYTDVFPPLPPIEVGLVSQADVNTRGRTDNAPFDHVLNAVASLQGTGAVGAAGDGGFFPINYVNSPQGQHTLPSLTDFSIFNGDFTMACRYKPQSTTANFGAFDAGDGTTSHVIQAAGKDLFSGSARFEVTSPSESLAPYTGGSNPTTAENVMVMTREGNQIRNFMNGVETAGSPRTFNATDFAITRLIWGRQTLQGNWDRYRGDVFWTSVHDRALPLSEIELLDDTPNPWV